MRGRDVVNTRSLLCIALLFGSLQAIADKKRVVLQLDGDHQFRYAGFYAAQWNGLYEKAGLDVVIRSAASENGLRPSVVERVTSGEATFGIGGAELLLAKDTGAPVVVLAVILQRSSIELYAKATDVVSMPIDIAHIRLQQVTDPLYKLTRELLYDMHGSADEPDSRVLDLPAEASRLGKVDVALGDSLMFPYEAIQSQQDFVPVKLSHRGVDLPGSSIFTSQEALAENPDLIEAFVLASLEGWRDALQDSDAVAMRLTRDRLAVGRHRELFGVNFYQIDKVRELAMFPVVPLGNNSADRWERAHQQLTAAGMLNNPFSAAEFIYDPVKILKEDAARTAWWIKHGVPSLIALLLLAATAYIYYWRQQKRSAMRLYREANYDAITGLPNRTFALRLLSDAINDVQISGVDLYVLFIDLDGFKRVNDNFGHDIGDQLLRAASERLRYVCADHSHVARLGGDEFLIIAPQFSNAGVIEIAEAALHQMNTAFKIKGKEVHIGASVGIANRWTYHCTSDKLLQRADAAMYLAKSTGKNQYRFYDSGLGEALREKNDIELQLANAIDRGELSVHYQPIVSVYNGRCVGAEALLRWDNGKLGQVSPERFIPVAEECGLIGDIGRWVLEKSVQQLTLWQAQHDQTFELAVNVSPRQFRDNELFDRMVQYTSAAGVAPATVKIEITEGLLASSNRDTTVLLKKISEAGFGISIDDFGTGYSSLNYLRHFPANTLKVDRSFVSDIFKDQRNQALVQAIVRMAHSLGMAVVAEGVETRGQADFLGLQRCDYVQGYLYSKPVSADEFTQYLATQRRQFQLTKRHRLKTKSMSVASVVDV